MSGAGGALAARLAAGPMAGRRGTLVADELGEAGTRHGEAFRDLLAGVAAYSPFLWRLARADPERLDRLAASSPEAARDALAASQARIGDRVRAGELTRDGAVRELRRHRAELALLVALADLGGVWDVTEVTAALSAFADASVGSAVAVALSEAERAGHLRALDAADPGAGSGLVVLAFGKHGAGELNYSSDIDLVLFFDPEAAALARRDTGAATYTRIGQSLARLLGERTGEGYVHRVDYRLRPDPGSTPTAVSLPAAYTYYESVGQNWERAAMIKARPVAGDLALGERFLADMTPFVWRKYFDFNAIADIHAMKRQIHAVRGHETIAVAGHDIKLGRGGIREVEFFVQTQQLVFGGRRPALRGRRTLDMLAALATEGWISAGARDEMGEAYRFLRRTEHRLQMVADEQTQRLPSGPEELKAFARFAGFRDLRAFSRALAGRAARVQHHYGRLFETGGDLASDLGDLVFTGSEHDPGTRETLRRLGFRDPAAAAETVRGWHFGRRAAIGGARAREVLTELLPSLLAAFGGTAEPDAALARLDAAFGRMPAAVELLAILRQNRGLRQLFADLLGTAPRLAETVMVAPHVLDPIIDPGFVRPPDGTEAVEAEARALIGQARDTEDFLDRVRDAARQMQFVTGARLLSGVLTPRDAGTQYAAVATAIVRACLDWTGRAFAREHGLVPAGRIAVVGLGRLGAGALTAASDLDLMVVYDFDAAARDSSGARPLDAVVYYTRLTQRLIAALTAPTRRGKLFELDLRLRPSGRKGPVATQFAGLVAYHEREAELWEQMALSRARVLAGDASLAAAIMERVGHILRRPRDEAAVFASVAAMRRLIEAEKGAGDGWDLKLAPGGTLDLDFLAQALLLAHAAGHPSLVSASTPTILAAAAAAGLLSAEDARTLLEADRLFDEVVHRQRMMSGGSLDIGSTAAMRDRLAVMCGVPNAAHLRQALDGLRADVRAVFERRLGAV